MMKSRFLPEDVLPEASRSSRGLATDAASRAGFILLIELLLAMSILMGGILAFVTLLGTTHETSVEAGNDITTALFADTVLNQLRAEAYAAAESNQWHTFWNDLRANGTNMATQVMWGGTGNVIRASTAGEVFTVDMVGLGWHSDDGTHDIGTEYSLRYSMSIAPDTPFTSNSAVARVQIKVWPGPEGPTENSDAFVFYSEFHNTGGL